MTKRRRTNPRFRRALEIAERERRDNRPLSVAVIRLEHWRMQNQDRTWAIQAPIFNAGETEFEVRLCTWGGRRIVEHADTLSEAVVAALQVWELA